MGAFRQAKVRATDSCSPVRSQVRDQLNSEIEISFPFFCQLSPAPWRQGKRSFPVGETAAALYDDTSMNGSNGPASPIGAEPGDREGPTEEMPERAFYMYAPQFHWTLAMGAAKDRLARSAVESIAHEQYRFGTQMKECHRRLLGGQVEAERRVIELEAWVAKLQDELAV